MPNFPDEIPIPGAKQAQAVVAAIGGFIGLAAFINFAAGNVGGGLAAMFIAGGAFVVASMIKTTRKFQDGVGRYR